MSRLGFASIGLGFIAAMGMRDQGEIKLRIEGVRLDVSVTEDGGPVEGLKADDFEVFDQGVRQSVDTISMPGRLAVAIVIDTSLSIEPGGVLQAIDRAQAMTNVLEPADRVAVLAFHDRVVPFLGMTSNRSLIGSALAGVTRLGPGAIARSVVRDATFAAVGLVGTDSGLGLITLFSDGMDNASWLDQAELGRTLATRGIVVDLIRLASRRNTFDDYPPGALRPDDVALDTGGTVMNAADTDLIPRYRRRFSDLRKTYILTYTPTGVKRDDGWHPVRVRVPGRRASVKTRPGYAATESAR